MVKSTNVVTLSIDWCETNEIMQLDWPAITKGKVQPIATVEWWPGRAEPVDLVATARYRFVAKDRLPHRVTLNYAKSDHGHLDGEETVWGQAEIFISEDLREATAYWRNSPESEAEGYGSGDGVCRVLSGAESEVAFVPSLARLGQGQFRLDALVASGWRCAITGETLPCLLDAAHIVEVRNKGWHGVGNALILRADLHRLWDAGYFDIAPDGELIPLDGLPPTYRELLQTKRRLGQADVVRVGKTLALRAKAPN